MQKMTIINSIKWGQDVHQNNILHHHKFNLFITEIHMMYGNKDWKLIVGRISVYNFPLYSYTANKYF